MPLPERLKILRQRPRSVENDGAALPDALQAARAVVPSGRAAPLAGPGSDGNALEDEAGEASGAAVAGNELTYSGCPDPILRALHTSGAFGGSAKDLEQATGISKTRVAKRLRELIDARLVTKVGRRYYEGEPKFVAAKAKPPDQRRREGVMPALFPDLDLRGDKNRA